LVRAATTVLAWATLMVVVATRLDLTVKVSTVWVEEVMAGQKVVEKNHLKIQFLIENK